MDTLLFLLFCLAIGYVIVWVVINERRGNKNGEWGIIAIRATVEDPKLPRDGRQSELNAATGSRAQNRQDLTKRTR